MPRRPSDKTREEFILYRWWDNRGRLLYVGKSTSLFRRISDHRRGSAFFAEAEVMTIQRLESAQGLADAERQAIRAENPVYNIADGRHDSGKSSRTIVVGDLDPSTSGYWSPIRYHEIAFGNVIRWAFKNTPTEVVGQGLAEDWDYNDDDNEHEWYVYTIDSEEIVLDRITSGLFEIKRWVAAPGDRVVEAYKEATVKGLAGVGGDSDAR